MSPHARVCRLLFLALALAASFTGCIGKIDIDIDFPLPFSHEEELVIMPDGSGKITFTTILLAAKAGESAKGQPAAPAANPNVSVYPSVFTLKGAAACTKMQLEGVGNNCLRQSFTVYFEDVNQFRFAGVLLKWGPLMFWALSEPSNAVNVMAMPTVFRYHKLADGFELEIRDPDIAAALRRLDQRGGSLDLSWLHRYLSFAASKEQTAYLKSIAQAPEEPDDLAGAGPGARAFAKAVLEGPGFSQTCSMPGQIREATGWTSSEGRTASLRVTAVMERTDDEAEPQAGDALAKLQADQCVRRIVCGPSSVPDDVVAQFRQELEAARPGWEAARRAQVEAFVESALQKPRKASPPRGRRVRAPRAPKPLEVKQTLQFVVDRFPEDALEIAKARLERQPDAAKLLLEVIVEQDPKGELGKKARQLLDHAADVEAEGKVSGLLQGASVLLQGEKVEAATRRLKEIVAKHPNSKVAPGADEVLKLLEDGKLEDAKTRLQKIIDRHLNAP